MVWHCGTLSLNSTCLQQYLPLSSFPSFWLDFFFFFNIVGFVLINTLHVSPSKVYSEAHWVYACHMKCAMEIKLTLTLTFHSAAAYSKVTISPLSSFQESIPLLQLLLLFLQCGDGDQQLYLEAAVQHGCRDMAGVPYRPNHHAERIWKHGRRWA